VAGRGVRVRAWKECSRGRPCDYTGITYDLLRGGSGVQWPCTADAPGGTERLYGDGRFPTAPETTETYGQDLETGAELTAGEYRAKQPGGRAFLHALDYTPSPEVPDDEHPMVMTTGRTVYQFHTRTKTGRARELAAAAPDAWVELSPEDAGRLGVAEGDLVRVESARGALQAPARLRGIRPGTVFVPFHYGWWDGGGPGERTANELTPTAWDPVSRQPLFKVTAVRVVQAAGAAEARVDGR
jgi:anaerobic selenocysteine-containing dehydrogenase